MFHLCLQMDWQNCRRRILWFATNLQNKLSCIGGCGSYLIFCQIMIVVVKILVKNIAKNGGHHVNWILKQNLKSSSPVWPNNFTAQQFDLKYEIWTIHAELMNYSFSVEGKRRIQKTWMSVKWENNWLKSRFLQIIWRKIWKAHQWKQFEEKCEKLTNAKSPLPLSWRWLLPVHLTIKEIGRISISIIMFK